MAMARNRRKPLYEVIGKTFAKSGYGKTLEQPHPEKSGKDKPTAARSAIRVSERPAQWPRRPKIVQFNADRIEISMPYQIAIALLLGVVLLVLIVFRLGQITYLSSQKTADSAAKMPKNQQTEAEQVVSEASQTPVPTEEIAPVSAFVENIEPAEPKGNNRIVIQTYQLRTHLEPVKQYFAEKGVETEIRRIGGIYYLVTEKRYENPERQGTDGYIAKQEIIKLGAKYKAPQGYETFGSRPFHDAYGMRFDD